MTNAIDIAKLKPHPKNSEIYGTEDVSDLVKSIKEHGLHNPIVVNNDFVIISGHRRYQAALEIGLTEVPYIVKQFDSEIDELEALILENAYRPQKTQEQKTKEGMALEKVIAERAKIRKLLTQNNNASKTISDREDSAQSEYGRTRDIVAKKTGHTSGKLYEQSKKVVKEIDKLKAEGKNDDAKLLSDTLEKAPSAAYELVKAGLDNISYEDKTNLNAGNTTVNSIIKNMSKPKQVNQTADDTAVHGTMIDVKEMMLESDFVSKCTQEELLKYKEQTETEIKILTDILDRINSGINNMQDNGLTCIFTSVVLDSHEEREKILQREKSEWPLSIIYAYDIGNGEQAKAWRKIEVDLGLCDHKNKPILPFEVYREYAIEYEPSKHESIKNRIKKIISKSETA